jgi:hypothetical protein
MAQPVGGQFLFTLADSYAPGTPATIDTLRGWTKYKVDYPAVIDPTYTLSGLFESDAYPANMIIDTRTMTICDVFEGSPEPDNAGSGGQSFWQHFSRVITDPKACTN